MTELLVWPNHAGIPGGITGGETNICQLKFVYNGAAMLYTNVQLASNSQHSTFVAENSTFVQLGSGIAKVHHEFPCMVLNTTLCSS